LNFLPYAMRHSPNIFKQFFVQTINVFISGLKDTNSRVLEEFWQPAIQFFQEFPESGDAIAAKSINLFKEALFTLIRNGARGSGRIAYPGLCQLVKAFPIKVRKFVNYFIRRMQFFRYHGY
jgi:hypothetical protein